MAHKIPVITNELGAKGIGLKNGLIGNTADELVQRYIELMNMNEGQQNILIRNAFNLVKERFDNQINQQEILSIFEAL